MSNSGESAVWMQAAHHRARGKGVSRPLYRFARLVLTPPLRIPLRIRVAGRDNVPATGAAILAPNHKSFVDVFLIGLVLRRPVRFMAKSELFTGPLRALLPRLGAFPVVRGGADGEAFETARQLLANGELVVVFPEGTRVDDDDALGAPHHGAGRLAIATGAPIVPVAIAGTANLLFGPLPKPRRVHIALLPPVDARAVADSDDPVADLIDGQVWPAVVGEYGRLRATGGIVVAIVAALGIGGGMLARRASRREPRLLGFVEPRRLRHRRRGPIARLRRR